MPEEHRSPREIADRYVDALASLDPLVGTSLGIRPHDDRMPDLSPEGTAARDELARATLAELDASVAAGVADELERRCAGVLHERLEAALLISEAGEHLRSVGNLFSPVQRVRQVFLLMPTATEEDWAVVARRMARVGDAYDSYLRSLEAGAAQGLLAAPRQVEVVVEQLDEWLGEAGTGARGGGSWFAQHVSGGPEALRSALDEAAASATAAAARVRDHLRDVYLPRAAGIPDAVGPERYRRWARQWTGADLDVGEAYRWGWEEHARLDREMRAAAELVLPGATPLEAMRHLDEHGEAVEGEEAVRRRLQAMMDEVITELHGTHFDLADPVRAVEAMIAPPGGAAAPYYTRPSMDFSRPGRTWLPTLGATRFPWWSLVSTWYHEGVPGHHLQLAQWVHVAPRLTMYQTSLGSNSAVTEGWALYAETLMDELGYLRTPGERLGYLDAQQMRAVRVIIDIGMHLELEIPDDQAFHPGGRWTPELAREFFGLHCGRGPAFLDSELVRYLGMPAQAITYKLGERAWLAGREAARARQGDAFDLKAWHMAALSMGSLGLGDLVAELAEL